MYTEKHHNAASPKAKQCGTMEKENTQKTRIALYTCIPFLKELRNEIFKAEFLGP